MPKQPASASASTSKATSQNPPKSKKPGRRTAAVRIIEFTRWLPSTPSTDIQLPGDQSFWLTNGVVGAEIREDETLFDVNIVDTNVREKIEISVRGEKQPVMHSLYFFQYVIGRIMGDNEDEPVNPKHVFRPRPATGLVTPNGPGPMPGLPGGPPLRG